MRDNEQTLQDLAHTVGCIRQRHLLNTAAGTPESVPVRKETMRKKDCLVSMLASGSKGNCAYISCGNTRILIDAGISCRRVETGLRRYGCTLADIDAVFLTHEHQDHVSGLRTLLKKSQMPVYTTRETWQAIGNAVVGHQNRFMPVMRRTQVGEMQIVPFAISHDAARPVGYSVYHEQVKVTLATDLGKITPAVLQAAAYSDIFILEANHDEQMVRNGAYPYYLQQRILGQLGHLSNRTAAAFLREVPNKGRMQVLLAHRSETNNTPSLALRTVRTILSQGGRAVGQDVILRLAGQHGAVRMEHPDFGQRQRTY